MTAPPCGYCMEEGRETPATFEDATSWACEEHARCSCGTRLAENVRPDGVWVYCPRCNDELGYDLCRRCGGRQTVIETRTGAHLVCLACAQAAA